MESFLVATLRSIELSNVLRGECQRLSERVLSRIPRMASPPIAEPVITEPMVVFRVRIHVDSRLVVGIIADDRTYYDAITGPGARADEISLEPGRPPRHSKRLAMSKEPP